MHSDHKSELKRRVFQAAEAALSRQQYVTAIDVLCGMGLLAPTQVASWRKGESISWSGSSKGTSRRFHCRCRCSDGRAFKIFNSNERQGPDRVVARGYGSILEGYRHHPELKFLGQDGRPCGIDTCGVLRRMSIEGDFKQPIRKESNRRWAEGDDASLLANPDNEELDSTGTVFKPDNPAKYHRSLSACPAEIREWLKTVSLSKIEKQYGISRQVLRAARDGRPVQRGIRKKLKRLYQYHVIQGVEL
jgi:hypothetical protein